MKKKYCPSCLTEKPEEGGKLFFLQESKKRKIPMWRCAVCVEKKKEFILKRKQEQKQKKDS